MLSILFIILGIGFIIIIHELGHFLTAKFFKIGVEEFGIGFPPRLWGKKIKNTIYSINWLPLGGFVKIVGENSNQTVAEEKLTLGQPFYQAKFWSRFLILFAGVFTNFIFGYILITALFLIGRDGHPVVTQVIENMPAQSAGLAVGDQFIDFKTPQELIEYIENNQNNKVIFNIERQSELLAISVYLGEKIPTWLLRGPALDWLVIFGLLFIIYAQYSII